MMCLAAAVTIPQPAASSIAPVAWSQLSRWQATSTGGSDGSRPTRSAMTLPDWALAMVVLSRRRRIVTGLPRARMRTSCSASGMVSAPAGIGLAPSVKLIVPGVRVAVMVGADRADDDGDRAFLAGERRAGAARGAELAVARTVLVGLHAMVDEDDLAAHRGVGGGARGHRRCRRRRLAPVTPAGPVEAELPSAATTSFCGKGATMSAPSGPRTHTGM